MVRNEAPTPELSRRVYCRVSIRRLQVSLGHEDGRPAIARHRERVLRPLDGDDVRRGGAGVIHDRHLAAVRVLEGDRVPAAGADDRRAGRVFKDVRAAIKAADCTRKMAVSVFDEVFTVSSASCAQPVP